MTVTERQRHDLLIAMEEVLGAAHAETLMNLLPPVGWADVSTKHDLEQQRVLLKGDIERLRTELQGDIERLRTELQGDIEQLRAAMRAEIQSVRADLERSMRQQLVTYLSINAVLVTIVAAIVQLAG